MASTNKIENKILKTSLNPNAAEFVPSKIKSLPRNDGNAQSSSLDDPISLGKEILDQLPLNASDYSDDEARKFWLHQLPDDITPDFKATQEELQIASDPSLLMDGLSINNGIESSQFSVSGTKHLSKRQDALSVNGATDNRSGLGYSGDSSPWSKQFENGNQNNGINEVFDKVNSNDEFLKELLFDRIDLSIASLKPLEFLTAKFPFFSADCIANSYLRNQCDLKSTMIYLAQIELQDDHSFIQNPNSKMLSDAHKGSFKYGHDDVKRGPSAYHLINKGSFLFNKHKPSDTSRGALGFASDVHKFRSQNPSHRAYERNCSQDMNTGSSISPQLVTNSYNGHLKSMYMDKLQGTDNVYSESREEPHNFGLPDNASFDQASPAFFFDNEAFARNILQLKTTNDNVRENIFRQRNPAFQEDQYHGWCAKDPLINLHGLQLIEAMHVLSREVNTLRMMARSAGQRVQVLVLIGTVLHTNGTHTPSMLPEDAIKQYLLEEGLQFSQPQPGLIRLLVC